MRGSIVVLAMVMTALTARVTKGQSPTPAPSADDKQCIQRDRGNPSDTGLTNRADPTQQGNKDCTPPTVGHTTVSGTVFFDVNTNGILDPDEVGLSGWNVQLTNGSVNQLAMTDSTGAFSFSGLAAGTYTLCVLPPAGWTQISPIPGAPCGGGTGYSIVAPVSPVDVFLPGKNFGYISQ